MCYTNFEYFHKDPLDSFLLSLGMQMREDWEIEVHNSSFGAIIRSVAACKNEKIVLVVDEVEGINTEYLNDFLLTIRALYHK